MKQQGSQAVSEAEKDAHAEDADGQPELDRVFDGGRDAFSVALCLFFGYDRQQHGGDGRGHRIGKHQKGERHTGQDSVQAQGIRRAEPE